MALIGMYNEFGRLKAAALYRPNPLEIDQTDAAAAMYIELPNIANVMREFDGIVQKLTELGVEVVVLDGKDATPATSNMIYLRDVATTIGDRIFLSNMKHELRSEEPGKFAKLLTAYNPEYAQHIQTLPEEALIEGADVLILSGKEACFYTGSRTNTAAREAISSAMPGLKTWEIAANIDGVPQHILGAYHIIDRDLVSRRKTYCQDSIGDMTYIDFDENEETKQGFSLNIVTIGPREILMPASRPKTKAKLESYGITCHEVEINEIHKMGGGLACMLLPLRREE